MSHLQAQQGRDREFVTEGTSLIRALVRKHMERVCAGYQAQIERGEHPHANGYYQAVLDAAPQAERIWTSLLERAAFGPKIYDVAGGFDPAKEMPPVDMNAIEVPRRLQFALRTQARNMETADNTNHVEEAMRALIVPNADVDEQARVQTTFTSNDYSSLFYDVENAVRNLRARGTGNPG